MASSRTSEVTHELKCWPHPFNNVLSRLKTHEVRVNDRCFRAGDRIRLCEYDPATDRYTGSTCLVLITYITEGGTLGLPENLCVLSIQLEEWEQPHLEARTE